MPGKVIYREYRVTTVNIDLRAMENQRKRLLEGGPAGGHGNTGSCHQSSMKRQADLLSRKQARRPFIRNRTIIDRCAAGKLSQNRGMAQGVQD